jgi:hypothetical protein
MHAPGGVNRFAAHPAPGPARPPARSASEPGLSAASSLLAPPAPGTSAADDHANGHAPAPSDATVAPSAPASAGLAAAPGSGCTAPQLRRFIKSRPYVPMHELRRRFGINGSEDDVTAIELDVGSIYIGLPAREGQLLGELLRGGEVGYELSLDPRTPVVVGVYPMRPVPRH